MAYGRRKTWESGMLAMAILNAGGFSGDYRPAIERRSGYRWVSSAQLLAKMGVRLQ